MDERNNPWTSDTHICPYVSHLLSRTNPGFHSANCNPIYFFFCFVNLAGAKIETSLPLVPLQNAAPHGQSKQNLKPLWKFLNRLTVCSVLKRTYVKIYLQILQVLILFCFLFCFNPHKQDFLKSIMKLTNVFFGNVSYFFFSRWILKVFSIRWDFKNWNL